MQNLLRKNFIRALLLATFVLMQAAATPLRAESGAGPASGQHDFDWEIGTWKTQVRRLAKPLSDSDEWVEYSGTSVVRKVLDGRANLVELRVQGAAGRIEGVSLRLFNPHTEQWSLNYASAANGMLTRPVYGSFRDGRGEFFGQEDLDGRAILVRFVISEITPRSARFEQAFSQDGGRTWEINWIATDTRIEEADGRTGPSTIQNRSIAIPAMIFDADALASRRAPVQSRHVSTSSSTEANTDLRTCLSTSVSPTRNGKAPDATPISRVARMQPLPSVDDTHRWSACRWAKATRPTSTA